MQSVADLAWEISLLEEEVVRKELHLLSLYRAAFDPYLGVSPRASAQVQKLSPAAIHECSDVMMHAKETVMIRWSKNRTVNAAKRLLTKAPFA